MTVVPSGRDDRIEIAAIAKVRERLAVEWIGAREDIEAAVDRAVQYFAAAPIRTYIPVLVERWARTDLRAMPSASPENTSDISTSVPKG
ncbi:MAG TPA: hypothetical protein VGF84_09215 [Micromonosporaceae bacterium]|jgi:hypothetical protein